MKAFIPMTRRSSAAVGSLGPTVSSANLSLLAGWDSIWQEGEGLYVQPAGPGSIGGEGIPFGHVAALRLKITAPEGRSADRIVSARLNGQPVEPAERGVLVPLEMDEADVEIILG